MIPSKKKLNSRNCNSQAFYWKKKHYRGGKREYLIIESFQVELIGTLIGYGFTNNSYFLAFLFSFFTDIFKKKTEDSFMIINHI